MPKLLLMTAVTVCSLSGLAPGTSVAQVSPLGPSSSPIGDQAGTLVFQPEFFAAQTPTTALEMVEKVPGFTLNDGDGSRGFEGAVGNVLINGVRPASKSDTGSAVLARTPAAQVERIELIRGGAQGSHPRPARAG